MADAIGQPFQKVGLMNVRLAQLPALNQGFRTAAASQDIPEPIFISDYIQYWAFWVSSSCSAVENCCRRPIAMNGPL